MNRINPVALLLIGSGAAIGAACGAVLIGLAIGCSIVLFSTLYARRRR